MLPAYEYCLKCSHTFNLLDDRGAISVTERTGSIGHIRNLAVTPAEQGHGIGRALIDHALQHFRRQGMRAARIETLEQNERCAEFYPRLGFTEVGRQVFYFKELD